MSTRQMPGPRRRPIFHSRSAALAALVLATGLLGACSGLTPGGGAEGDALPTNERGGAAVVARVEGDAITLGEVDARIRKELWEARFGAGGDNEQALFEARSETLAHIITDRLVAEEAEKAGVSVETWLDAAVKALDPASVEKVKAFYEKNRARIPDEMTFEDIAPRIATFLENEARKQVAGQLARDRDVEVLLTPPRVAVAAEGPALGPEDAPVTLIEFSDFQCPYCKRVAPTIDALREKFPDELRVVYRHLPLGSHSRARPAAIASICADQQGRFWPYHDLLFEHSGELSDENLRDYAARLELDPAAFEACLADPATAAKVDADEAAANLAGARGTPAFFLNGIPISGAQPIERFVELIERELARQATSTDR